MSFKHGNAAYTSVVYNFGQTKNSEETMTWTPIAIEKVCDLIRETEKALNGELLNFWELIKVYPEKWNEETYGKEGNGFWVVGLIGKKVIYYNDIEDGFNISDYKTCGKIENYFCNQDELIWTIAQLFDLIKFERGIQWDPGLSTNLR